MAFYLIKCVPEKQTDQPDRILKISEIKAAVKRDTDLDWGKKFKENQLYRRRDGSFVSIPSDEGFFFKLDPEATFAVCSEFFDGISIMTSGDPSVANKCQALADAMGAKLFRIRSVREDQSERQ
ncbi:hypothetical protein [Pedosphaera parvula]|uniref:Uncharacterized protein n=1 Tax=Pedosphaera parvula (strain Ellin514) TaxID=320771 RepID=B9XFE1_PEDPL|nr:hypothetical protein [Pedosphaera parvula]EEF61305.1 hypothetical protein Cflav_PD4326 [Pedosphaera parvula Ellin514]